jgi:predicted enzyme related to lactoylglutathione lyase
MLARMSAPTSVIAAAFATNFRDYRDRIHRLAGMVSDAQFWARPYPYGNSMGHLVLHLTGNLNFFVGREMAGTGYVRDREREFHEPAPPSRSEALRRLDEAVDLVIATLQAQSPSDWSAPYTAGGPAFAHDRFGACVRLVAHFYHHVGQMIYLSKEHERQTEAGARGSRSTRYAHTNLVARDWRRLGAFYEQALGCVRLDPPRDLSGDWLSRGTGVPGARITGAHYRMPGGGPDGPTLEIFQYDVLAEAPPPPANRVGFGHIAFAVPDVEQARAQVLSAGGGEVGTTESVPIAGAGQITWTYVRDPEGNIIELQQAGEAPLGPASAPPRQRSA